MFLLDTDHVIILQQQTAGLFSTLQARISAYSLDDFLISVVSFQEQVAGWQAFLARKRSARHVVQAYAQFQRLLTDYSQAQLADFNVDAAARFDDLRRQGVRIGTMDLRIASIALAGDHTVLTRNLVDFEKVPGLRVEDWTVAAPEKSR